MAVLMLALAVGLALLGMAIPVHFRSVSTVLLRLSGEGTPSAVEMASERLAGGQPGPARLLLDFAEHPGAASVETRQLRSQLEELLQARPAFRLTGGTAPVLSAALAEVPIDPDSAARSVEQGGVVALLIPRERRQALAGALGESPNAYVQTILGGRDLTGWVNLSPVSSAAGGPLDTALLLLALQAESNPEPTALDREVAAHIQMARAGEIDALRRLENTLMAVLSLGQRLDWLQWRVLAQRLDSMAELRRSAGLLRTYPERLPLLYTAFLMTDAQPGRVVDAVQTLSTETATPLDILAAAARRNTGALRRLIEQPRPLYSPPPLLTRLDPLVDTLRPTALGRLAADQPRSAAILKSTAFFAAGWLLAAALVLSWHAASVRRWERRGRRPPRNLFPRGPASLLRYLAAGGTVCLILWGTVEPRLLEATAQRAELRFDFSLAQSLGSLNTSTTVMNSIDQVTLLVLLIFALLQLVIYAFCLIKISEIRRTTVSPEAKLKLIENEDNLFDTGLYVGLGGTVASLILITLGVVETALTAAYASTLFGILCTATIKVLHLRPFRRRLILEIEDERELAPADALKSEPKTPTRL